MSIVKKSGIGSLRGARLEAYLAAGVGALGLAASSEAGVVIIDLTGYTGDNMGIAPGPGAYPAGRFTSTTLIPGSTFLGFNNVYGLYTGLSVQGVPSGGILATTGNGILDVPINVGPGVAIGPSSGTFEMGYSTTVFRNNSRAVADFGPNSFLGFRTAADQYGYIEVLWTSSTDTFKLISAAYESTPFTSIVTPGGAAAVPEPSSMAVVALLVGGTALRQWRKKRRDQVATSDESLVS